MNDAMFLKQFEAAHLHPFPHRDHIKMAWLYLRRDGWENGYAQIQAGLKHFAQAHGAPDKYHETITCFWAKVVQHAIEVHPEIEDFAAFEAAFPILFDQGAINQHYSKEALWSSEARHVWVEPDLIAMP